MLLRRVAGLSSAATIGSSIAWLQQNFAASGSVTSEPPPLPRGARVVVVGGGIAGVTAAHEIGRRGYRVRVIEESAHICSESSASYGNAGTLGITRPNTLDSTAALSAMVRGVLGAARDGTSTATGGVFFDPATLTDPLFLRWAVCWLRTLVSTAPLCWRELNAASQDATFRVAAAEGLTAAAGMRVDGRLTLSSAAPHAPGPTVAAARPPDGSIDGVMRAREPHVQLVAPPDARVAVATVTAEDGQGSCELFTRGLAARAVARFGVVLEPSTRATRLLTDPATGGVCGVVTEGGAVYAAEAVVLANGARVAPLAATAGVYVPVQPLRGYSVSATATATSVQQHIIYSDVHLYVTRLPTSAGDTLRFTCYGEMVPASAPTPPSALLQARLRALVEAQIPNVCSLCDWAHAVEWHGDRPLTPDAYPLAGATRVPGLYLHCGHSFNGWRDACLSARVLGEVLAGPETGAEAAPLPDSPSALRLASRVYSPRRFQPWPAWPG